MTFSRGQEPENSFHSFTFTQGHVQALTAIGWHALEMEGNASKAVYYFEKAYKRGSPEAAHNLGHIYYNGLYPGKPADRVRSGNIRWLQ